LSHWKNLWDAIADKLWNDSPKIITGITVAMKIGQKVKVLRLRQKMGADVIEKIKQNPMGTVKDFKMTDGSGVGVVVDFGNGVSTWFFEDEVQVVQ
jgi:hypothetical protein